MKKLLSALLVLAVFLSAALAEGENPAEEFEAMLPSAAKEPEPEKEAPAEPEEEPDIDSAPIDDMMFPEDDLPFIMPVPEIPESYEGYVKSGGERTFGTLAELLAEPGGKTIYVLAKKPVRIESFPLILLKDVRLLPDPETFGEGSTVIVTADGEPFDPNGIEEDAEAALVISVVEKEEPKPDEKPDETEKPELRVTPRSFTEGAWQNEIPGFLLDGIPAAEYSYAAIIYDERIVPLSGDEFYAQEEGMYTVRFAILDALGDIVDKSKEYALMLDFTAPELTIEVSEEYDYTMTLRADDALSGMEGLSLDGGETWVPLNEGESIVHTESRKKVFAPGAIQVRDQAGNVSANDVKIELDAIPKMSSFGGGGSGGSSAKSTPHASGEGDDSPYDAYDLALPEGAVDVLTLGGERIDLGLEIESGDIPSDGPAKFSAKLTHWATERAESEPAKDTLVLRAETGTAAEACTCTWRVNGAVLRKLYNTDIRYLALAAGDAVLSLPTVGFTAGTRYAELKMEGTSTSEFEYEIVMRLDPNAEGPAPAEGGWNMVLGCDVEIHVEVGGERFDMIDRASTPEMYPLDVYCGPTDLPEYPYGEYPRAEVEVW